MIIAASIIVALLTAWLLFNIIFDDVHDFTTCLRYYFTPDIISLFRGEWDADWWAELKLGVYLAIAAGSGILTYVGLHRLFPASH